MNDKDISDDRFCTIAALWMAGKDASVKQSTAEGYRKNLRKHLLPAFGDLPVSEITRERAAAFLTTVTTEGSPGCPPVSAGTASAMLTQLRSMLDYAAAEYGLSVQNLYGITLKKEEKKPMRILSREEERTLRSALTVNITLRNLGILLCLDTGIRIGELCALKWGDISDTDHTIFIHSTVTRLPSREAGAKTRLQITSPKGDQSIRTVPVPEGTAALLAQHRAPEEHFFLTDSPSDFADNRTMQYYLKRILTFCGIEDVRFADLRDTFAVRYLEDGGSLLRLSEILGHTNVSFTAGHYLPACEANQTKPGHL